MIGPGEPEEIQAMVVTDGFLDVLRTVPARGRDFTAEDDGSDAPLTVILTHGYWQRLAVPGGSPTDRCKALS